MVKREGLEVLAVVAIIAFIFQGRVKRLYRVIPGLSLHVRFGDGKAIRFRRVQPAGGEKEDEKKF